MRKPLIAGNWKMNLTADEGIKLVQSLVVSSDVEVVVAPASINIVPVQSFINENNLNITVAAQNVHEEENGAFTGEISTSMLGNIGVNTVIIGHSERRDIFNESDDLICLKVNKAIAAKINVILCVGEHLDKRESGEAENVVLNQISKALSNINEQEMENIVVAYEPVWAIGTGKTASSADAEEMHATIRKALCDKYNSDVAESTRILYGGSVKPGNIKELMSMTNIDGALVGGASLKSDSFNQLINF